MRNLSIKRSETFFRAEDNTKLFMQKWEVAGAVATIIITHGQAEHSDCYHRLISAFYQNEQAPLVNFIGWDMRGHGKSDGIRGYAQDVSEYVTDFNSLLNECTKQKLLTGKAILLSHSMGGLVQTCTLAQCESWQSHFSAQILSSPLFGVSVPVPGWKDTGSTLINSILPKLTLGNEIKNEQLTRDPEVIREYEKDTYRHNKISAGVYLGFKREFENIQTYAQKIKLPTLLHISDNDPVVSSEKALNFFDVLTSSDKNLKIFEGGTHELYNDTIREDVFKVVIEFCQKIVNH